MSDEKGNNTFQLLPVVAVIVVVACGAVVVDAAVVVFPVFVICK